MKNWKVYVSRPLPEESLVLLRSRSEVKLGPLGTIPKAELIKELEGQDAVLVSHTKFDEEVIAAIAPTCKVLASYGVGYDNIDVAAATKYGMIVTHNPGLVTADTADLTFALMLAVARRIVECDAYVRTGDVAWGPTVLVGSKVSGKKLGIVGSGRIASAVAKRAVGFDMEILYTSECQDPNFEELCGGRFVSKEELLKEADFLTLHLPLLPTTCHYISTGEMKLMKKSAILLNLARGPIVDEKALVAALESGEIAGAGLDVFEREPEVEAGLTKLSNVVMTPHNGTCTMETRTEQGESCARKIFAVLDGKEPENWVNPEVKLNK